VQACKSKCTAAPQHLGQDWSPPLYGVGQACLVYNPITNEVTSLALDAPGWS
jgi:hypothetical protein